MGVFLFQKIAQMVANRAKDLNKEIVSKILTNGDQKLLH